MKERIFKNLITTGAGILIFCLCFFLVYTQKTTLAEASPIITIGIGLIFWKDEKIKKFIKPQ